MKHSDKSNTAESLELADTKAWLSADSFAIGHLPFAICDWGQMLEIEGQWQMAYSPWQKTGEGIADNLSEKKANPG
jgi:hypothetical protein